jgi:hypothetical protein
LTSRIIRFRLSLCGDPHGGRIRLDVGFVASPGPIGSTFVPPTTGHAQKRFKGGSLETVRF